MADMALFAYAVMPNHLHILVRQSSAPLGHMMHRVMHRTAIMLRTAHGLEGHVFERRYYSGLCSTPEHVRAAIVYTHLNPWRAALCSDPAEYRWSSHGLYVASGATQQNQDSLAIVEGLRFFSHGDSDEHRLQYMAHVSFQIAIDRMLGGSVGPSSIVAPELCDAGDEHWLKHYQPALVQTVRPSHSRPIYDVAQKLLERLDPQCPLDLIRSGVRIRRVVALRRNIIAALLTNGYPGVDVARFFGLSDSAVSAVAVSLRA
jgi:hypothetical protein